MPEYIVHVDAERTYLEKWTVTVEAGDEEHARLIVEEFGDWELQESGDCLDGEPIDGLAIVAVTVQGPA